MYKKGIHTNKFFLTLSFLIMMSLGFSNNSYAESTNSVTATVRIAICGNNVKEGRQVCDNQDLDGKTCQDFGYLYGELKCGIACDEFDTSECYNSKEEIKDEEQEIIQEKEEDPIEQNNKESNDLEININKNSENNLLVLSEQTTDENENNNIYKSYYENPIQEITTNDYTARSPP